MLTKNPIKANPLTAAMLKISFLNMTLVLVFKIMGKEKIEIITHPSKNAWTSTKRASPIVFLSIPLFENKEIRPINDHTFPGTYLFNSDIPQR